MTLPALLDAHSLHQQLHNPSLLIIDLCSDDNYRAGHIPGAVHIAPSQLGSGIAPATGSLPTVQQLTALLCAIGFTPDKHVVAYDDAGGSWAGRMIWTLELLGFTAASLLDGGRNAWINAGFTLSDAAPAVTPSSLPPLHIDSTFIADKADILQQLGKADFAIWDARSPEEYAGSKVLAARGGHIPGAVNLEWTQLMDTQLRLLPLDVIRQLLDNAGLSKNKTLVTHCQTHRRSGLTWFVARKLLGYPAIKAYPGSWSDWGNDTNTPIEN